MSEPDIRAPGIRFLDIHLISSEFRATSRIDEGNLEYRLALTHMERLISDNKDGSSELYCLFKFDLMDGIEDPLCALKCTYAARYARDTESSMSWEQFTNGMALSHVIAYLREFVMNITTRSMLPRLFLPPLNANALVDEYEQIRAQPIEDYNDK